MRLRPNLVPCVAPALLALATASCSADSAAAQEETYQHRTGLAFTHPTGWEVQETEAGLVVTPPDVQRNAMGEPLELILINAQPAPGITTPDDPQVVDFFEQNFAPLRRVGDLEAIESRLGPARVFTFEGSLGTESVRQRVYVTVHEGKSVYLLHMAAGDGLLEEREGAARGLFGSFQWGESETAQAGASAGRLDRQLVGTWRRSSTSGSSGGGGSVHVTDQEAITFEGDGTALYGVGSSVSADVPGLSGSSAGDADVERGQWGIEGDMLVIRWANGAVDEFQYNVFTHSDGLPALKLQVRGGDPVYYR